MRSFLAAAALLALQAPACRALTCYTYASRGGGLPATGAGGTRGVATIRNGTALHCTGPSSRYAPSVS